MTPTEFFAAEANRVHELCDAIGVPRFTGDSPLSMSQRVELLLSAYGELLASYVAHSPNWRIS